MFRFGWTNASYVYGLQFMSSHQRRALEVCAPYETFARAEDLRRERDLEAVLFPEGNIAAEAQAD